MTVIGLTGGIGMGKSTAAELLARHDIPVIDTDVLARRVVEPGQPALTEIKAATRLAFRGVPFGAVMKTPTSSAARLCPPRRSRTTPPG